MSKIANKDNMLMKEEAKGILRNANVFDLLRGRYIYLEVYGINGHGTFHQE